MAIDKRPERERVNLPPRTFFYTVDQLANMLDVTEEYVLKTLLHYEGRSAGICPKSKLRAVNIAPEGEVPQWRISEQTFLGYMRYHGIKFYERTYIS